MGAGGGVYYLLSLLMLKSTVMFHSIPRYMDGEYSTRM